MNVEIFYERIFIITKYCPSLNLLVIDINNVESSTDSYSCNEVCNINNNNYKNNNSVVVNNSNCIDSENINIFILVIVKIIVSLLIM